MVVMLRVPAAGRRSELLLRPWLAADMPALLAEMDREYPTQGLWPNRNDRPDRRTWTGPTDDQDAVEWLESQDRGWRDGDWLPFAVLEQGRPVGGYCVAGQIGLMGMEVGDRVSKADMAEVRYWTAAGARSRGVASA